MNKLSIAATAASLLLLAGCQSSTSPTTPMSTSAVSGSAVTLKGSGATVATVNGTAIPASMLKALADGRHLDLSDPASKKQALGELKQYILLAQQAKALKVEQQPDLEALIQTARLQGVANAVLRAYSRAHPITDAQVAKEYHEQVGRLGNETYQITQLQFADQASADKAAKELKAGKPFGKVFDEWRTKATEARSYPQVFLSQLPPELASAVAKLKAKQATKTPIKSANGWHLLYINAITPFKPPALDKVSARIRKALEEKQARAYIESLQASATISVATPAKTASVKAPPTKPAAMGKAVSKHVVNDAKPAPASTSH